MRTRDGRIITGVNIDAYLGRMAVCAEAIAIGRSITEAGDQGIEKDRERRQQGAAYEQREPACHTEDPERCR